MQRLRRNYVPGGSYFFTVVTFGRRPILTTGSCRAFLRTAIETEQGKRPFSQDAVVLLPDHLHAIWTLPPDDVRYSLRWSRIKRLFTDQYLACGGTEGVRSMNRIRHRERAVWQHRIFEHTIADDADYKRCLDYIHWNPVKHGYVKRPRDYQWSSFRKWVEKGEYPLDWGCDGIDIGDFAGAE